MQPTLCSKCKKNVAVVFISKLDGEKTINEGLCLKCAKELGLPQVDDMMKRMGISDEDLETLNSEMMQAMNGVENIEDLPGGEEDSEEEEGKTATFPFLNRLFSGVLQGERRGGPERAPGEKGVLQKYQAEVFGELLHLPDPEGQGRQAGPGDRPGRGD